MKWFVVALLILLDTYVSCNKKIEDGMRVGYFIVSSILGIMIFMLT